MNYEIMDTDAGIGAHDHWVDARSKPTPIRWAVAGPEFALDSHIYEIPFEVRAASIDEIAGTSLDVSCFEIDPLCSHGIGPDYQRKNQSKTAENNRKIHGDVSEDLPWKPYRMSLFLATDRSAIASTNSYYCRTTTS